MDPDFNLKEGYGDKIKEALYRTKCILLVIRTNYSRTFAYFIPTHLRIQKTFEKTTP
jgi:hypothetical protein